MLLLGAGAGVWGNGALNPDWEPLLENDLETATRNLEVSEEELREIGNHDWGVAANGLALSRWALGDYAGAAEAWMRLVEWSFSGRGRNSVLRSPEFLEGYLSCLERSMGEVSIEERVMPLLRRLTSESEEPDKALLARRLLLELQRRAGDADGLARTAREIGVVTRWDAVVGPFGFAGSGDLEHRFEPETEPNQPTYDGYAGPVSWRKIGTELPDGYVDFISLIYPVEGAAYARASVEASGAGPGFLTLETKNSARVWWNGRLVLSRDRANLDLETFIVVPVDILDGENYLVVKTMHGGGGWGHRVSIRPEGYAAHIELEPSGSRVYPPCRPEDFTGASPRMYPGIEEMAGALDPEDLGEVDILAGVYAAELAWSRGRYNEAAEFLEKTIEIRPDWAPALMILGEIHSEAAWERAGSRSRLENQARNYFRAALAASRYTIPASEGLGEYFRTRKTYDSALEVLEEARKTAEEDLVESKDGTPPLVQGGLPGLEYALGRVYEDLEFDVEARRAYERARAAASGNADVWVRLSRLFRTNRAGVQAYEVAREGNRIFPIDTSLLTELDLAARSAGVEEQLFPALEKRLEIYPCEIGTRTTLAELLESLGRGEEAFRQYQSIAEFSPDRPRSSVRRGDYLLRTIDALSPAEEPRLTEALEYLDSAVEKQPQDVSLRRRIHATRQALAWIREGTTAVDGAPLPDLAFDIDYFDLDQSGFKDLPQEKAAAVYLLDLMVTTLYPNGTNTSLIHQSVLLKNKDGRSQFSEITVPHNAEILLARTVAPDGTIYQAETVTDTGNGLSVSMYGLEDGAVVDYTYRIKRQGIPSPGRDYEEFSYYFGEVANPMLLSRLVVLVPERVKVVWKAHPLDFAHEIRDATGFQVWSWEQRLSPGVKEESSLPSKELVVPTVKLTTCPDWSVGAKRGKGWLKGRREAEATVGEVASLLALDAHADLDKVSKVYEYVQEVIEPDGGGGSTVLDTLKTRAGSTFDRTVLAQALLEHMGVPSRIIFGYEPGEEERFPPLPGESWLGDALLVVPGHGERNGPFNHPKDLWISFASRYAPLGEIPSSLRGRIRFLNVPHGMVIQPPLNAALAGGWVERHLEFDLDPDGRSACSGKFHYHGDLRSSLRRAVVDQTLRERVVSAEVSRHVRGIEVEKAEFLGIEKLEENVTISFNGMVDRFLQPLGDDRSLEAVTEPSRLSSSAPEPDREKPVQFDDPVRYNPYQAGFRIASGTPEKSLDWYFREIPDDTVLISRFGYFILDYEVEGEKLWVTRTAYVPAQWIEPEDYVEFLEFCRAVDAAESERVIVSRFD